MNDDKSIDLKTENTNLTNELIVLRRKYKELDEDRHYVKSLLDAEFEKGIELKKENDQLKETNNFVELIANHRGEMVSFATSLIQDMGSEEMLKMWNDFTESMYQKWKKKRGIR